MKRKGISPLIATVLLIAFTIAVGGIISIWITQFAREQATDQDDKADRLSLCSESLIFFSKDGLNISSTNLTVIVSNDGTVNQTDIDLYAVGSDNTFFSNTTVATVSSTNPLEPGEMIQIRLPLASGYTDVDENLSSVTVTLGGSDQCAGKSYRVTV